MSQLIAITGPSLAGKTTLTDSLKKQDNIIVPRHITTREQRVDDEPGFYRYVSVDDFQWLREQDAMLFSSGAGNRLYGVLIEDLEESFLKADNAIVNISYKDIYQYILLEYRKMLITLTFHDIKEGMKKRNTIMSRTMTPEELMMRINAALSDQEAYFELIKKYSDCLLYTEELNKEEVFTKAMQKIKSLK